MTEKPCKKREETCDWLGEGKELGDGIESWREECWLCCRERGRKGRKKQVKDEKTVRKSEIREQQKGQMKKWCRGC